MRTSGKCVHHKYKWGGGGRWLAASCCSNALELRTSNFWDGSSGFNALSILICLFSFVWHRYLNFGEMCFVCWQVDFQLEQVFLCFDHYKIVATEILVGKRFRLFSISKHNNQTSIDIRLKKKCLPIPSSVLTYNISGKVGILLKTVRDYTNSPYSLIGGETEFLLQVVIKIYNFPIRI